MQAIFQSGGKQYRVCEGQIVCLEKLILDVGNNIIFDKILMLFNENNILLGNPIIPNKTIVGTVISHIKGKKIKIIKFRRRKHYRKNQGHRQFFTNVKIINIESIT